MVSSTKKIERKTRADKTEEKSKDQLESKSYLFGAEDNCSHDEVKFLGNDRGMNNYYKCEECDCIIIAEPEI